VLLRKVNLLFRRLWLQFSSQIYRWVFEVIRYWSLLRYSQFGRCDILLLLLFQDFRCNDDALALEFQVTLAIFIPNTLLVALFLHRDQPLGVQGMVLIDIDVIVGFWQGFIWERVDFLIVLDQGLAPIVEDIILRTHHCLVFEKEASSLRDQIIVLLEIPF